MSAIFFWGDWVFAGESGEYQSAVAPVTLYSSNLTADVCVAFDQWQSGLLQEG